MIGYNSEGKFISTVYNSNGSIITEPYDLTGNAITNTETSLKVMTYNVGQWRTGAHDNVPAEMDEAYYTLQNGIIETENPDILFLNEDSIEFSKTGRTSRSMLSQYYPYIIEKSNIEYTGSRENGFTRAICSKFPIYNYTVHLFDTVNEEYGSWYYDSCTVDVNNKLITLIVTHIFVSVYIPTAENYSIRAEQISKLINYLDSIPNFIVGGDFNSQNGSFTDNISPFVNKGYHVVNWDDSTQKWRFQTHATVGSKVFTSALDHIVSSDNFTEINAHVNDTKLHDNIEEDNDHSPLIATLRF